MLPATGSRADPDSTFDQPTVTTRRTTNHQPATRRWLLRQRALYRLTKQPKWKHISVSSSLCLISITTSFNFTFWSVFLAQMDEWKSLEVSYPIIWVKETHCEETSCRSAVFWGQEFDKKGNVERSLLVC